jgi:hypothetical protein
MRISHTKRIGGVAALAVAASLWALPAWGQSSSAARVPVPNNEMNMTMGHAGGDAAKPPTLAGRVAAARAATAKYSTNLAAAKADGYGIITKMMPNMGFHYMNPKITGFNVRKPQILVYEHTGNKWQLGALEWVFTKMPKTPPLPNATFGSFPAACHYKDGTFVPDQNQKTCPTTAPGSGAKFNFWHPDLITMHLWAWYPNTAGLYSSTNPLVAPFNGG